MVLRRRALIMRLFDMWHRLPFKIVFIVVVSFAVLHVYFIDTFEDRKHGITTIGIHVPGGGHINLPGTSKVKVADDEEYMAMCMAVKDQPNDLPEFLTHHYYHIGFRRFYIMDDGSNPPLSSVKDYGIPREAITFHYYNASDRRPTMQLRIYNQCNAWFGKKHTWMAYIDADEFLEVVSPNESLLSILKEFEKNDTIGAFGPNWRMHTSSDLQTRPTSARKGFTTCIYDDEEHRGDKSDNKHIKSIVRTSKYKDAFNPHTFNLKEGARLVGEDGGYVNHWAFRQPITRKRVALHHYAVKSWEEYEVKMNRSNAMDTAKGMEFWDHVQNITHVQCPEMARYNP